MPASALGHPLSVLRDGVTGFVDRTPRPVPLAASRIDIDIRSGLAVSTTTRTFSNAEDVAIEAVMTFPVGFDAVVTGLSARIDGRLLKAVAKAKNEARATYEEAIDRGKAAVLHEEVLRGLHVLSVGQLGPGKQVEVVIETVAPLSDLDGVPFLRIPTTAGQVYGTSPLMPADDLVTDPDTRHEAELTIRTDGGVPRFASGRDYADGMRIALDRAIEIVVPGMRFGTVAGHDGAGRAVKLTLRAAEGGNGALDLAIVADRSASMAGAIGRGRITNFEAMRRGLSNAMEALRTDDRIALWEFDQSCQRLGTAVGPGARGLPARLTRPQGGTELGQAVSTVAASGARDILVITDGQTYANEVSDAAKAGCRIGAVLVGEGSLDVMIGHLVAMTGGQLFYAPGADVGAAVETALSTFRTSGRGVEGSVGHHGPTRVRAERAGIVISAEWEPEAAGASADAAGRYAAALALSLFHEPKAAAFAAEQGLCSHVTSLVLVDEEGGRQDGLPEMRKVALMEHTAAAIYASADPGIVYSVAPPGYESLERPLFLRLEDSTGSPHRASSPHVGAISRKLRRFPHETDVFATDPNGVLEGDLSSLPDDLRREILELAEDAAVKALAAALRKPAVVVAAALVAERRSGRQAARIARKVFWRAPEDLLAAVRALRAAAA